jgi:uncharacterized protein
VTSTVVLLVELVVLFIGVSFLVEIMQRRFGPERIRRWMGGRPVVAALKGIVVGFVTPFCTYSAIPLLVGMRRAGVPPAGYVAFISAAPVLDPILFGALWLIVGPTVAVIYLVVTFVAALLLALTAQRLGVERHLEPVAEHAPTRQPVTIGASDPGLSEGSGCSSATEPWAGWRVESHAALCSSRTLLRSFGPLLLLGVAVGLVIEAVVSPAAAARVTTGSPWFAIPVASALGTPLYFSTELFVPIADSLHGAGVGVGAIVALTISGAGANLPEFIILTKMARPAAVAVFFGYVFAVAVTGGFLAHTLTT